MKYRLIPRAAKRISILGVGGLRLPKTVCNGREMVDDDRAFPLLQEAVRLGVNYFDTGWGYINEDSQRAIGHALRENRDRVYLANKLPLYLTKEPDDFWRFLERELRLMDTDHIDFFHFHMVGRAFWQKILDFRLIDAAERAKAKGLIDHICFSFHDVPDLMREMIDTGAFDSLLCQYNLVDQGNAAMMRYARERGMGVMVMGPNAGGNIAAGGDALLQKYPRSPAKTATELAMRFVWGNPDVDCALSGVESLEMLRENAGYAERANTVPADEWNHVREVTSGMLEISQMKDTYCTGCRYCDVCPLGIRPFVTLMAYNRWKIWGLEAGARSAYAEIGRDPWQGKSPVGCVGCGKCRNYCPQKIDIPSALRRATADFMMDAAGTVEPGFMHSIGPPGS
ncbi:MAG: aldo/keto reductase [Clostridiales bacterium]|nr:aldo/keto reductase [Clostridiales bacterium]